jgi:hypothetical protein
MSECVWFDSAFICVQNVKWCRKSLQMPACCMLCINVYLHGFWSWLFWCNAAITRCYSIQFWHNFTVVQRHCVCTAWISNIFIDSCTLPSSILHNHPYDTLLLQIYNLVLKYWFLRSTTCVAVVAYRIIAFVFRPAYEVRKCNDALGVGPRLWLHIQHKQ